MLGKCLGSGEAAEKETTALQIVTKSLRPDSGLQAESQGRLQSSPKSPEHLCPPSCSVLQRHAQGWPPGCVGSFWLPGEALPLHDRRICLREQIFQLKASSLSVKLEKDYPSSPSAILRSPGLPPDYRALGPFTEAARMEYPGGLIFPFYWAWAPASGLPQGPGLRQRGGAPWNLAAKHFLPSHLSASDTQAAFIHGLAGVSLPGGAFGRCEPPPSIDPFSSLCAS